MSETPVEPSDPATGDADGPPGGGGQRGGYRWVFGLGLVLLVILVVVLIVSNLPDNGVA